MSEPGDTEETSETVAEKPAESKPSRQDEGILSNLRPRSKEVEEIMEERAQKAKAAEDIPPEELTAEDLPKSPEEQRIKHLKRASERMAEKKLQAESQAQTETPAETPPEGVAPQTQEETKSPESEARFEPRDVFIYEPHSKTTGSLTRVNRVSGRSTGGEPHFEQLTIPLSEQDLGKKIAIEVELPLGYAYYTPHEGTSLDERIAEANLKRSGLPYENKPLFVKHTPGKGLDLKGKGYEIISAKDRIEEQAQELPKAA